MKNTLHRLLFTVMLAAAPTLLLMAQGYNWSQLRIGGGGRVTSIKAHPKVPNLFLLLRTWVPVTAGTMAHSAGKPCWSVQRCP
ncbi:hypothetical protein MKQ70_31520 [Chitinophaga sedimenti]|uniref:hypothetical protein n=1 Tax=Chitinophaga sedimenti TaxID=2033606 RepID=UPI00200307B0|nr:hypothetical protein [Chitinophaga sedimenti]MCK7559254.1 hypothetical protein [Chitinophaga sedimenti]